MQNPTLYAHSPQYFHSFFDLVQTNDLLYELEKSGEFTANLFRNIPVDMENYAYAPNKWTIKEVLRHIIDCERIFAYRAFRISRFDPIELAGFDEDMYIENAKSIDQNLNELVLEFETVRNATISLFKPMTEEMLDFKGTANQLLLTARSIGFMVVGHNLHHANFVNSHYLNN